MKAEEVLNLLQISRKTLHVYAHDGRIRYTVMPNKRYDYSEEDVYKILNKDVKRKTSSESSSVLPTSEITTISVLYFLKR